MVINWPSTVIVWRAVDPLNGAWDCCSVRDVPVRISSRQTSWTPSVWALLPDTAGLCTRASRGPAMTRRRLRTAPRTPQFAVAPRRLFKWINTEKEFAWKSFLGSHPLSPFTNSTVAFFFPFCLKNVFLFKRPQGSILWLFNKNISKEWNKKRSELQRYEWLSNYADKLRFNPFPQVKNKVKLFIIIIF